MSPKGASREQPTVHIESRSPAAEVRKSGDGEPAEGVSRELTRPSPITIETGAAPPLPLSAHAKEEVELSILSPASAALVVDVVEQRPSRHAKGNFDFGIRYSRNEPNPLPTDPSADHKYEKEVRSALMYPNPKSVQQCIAVLPHYSFNCARRAERIKDYASAIRQILRIIQENQWDLSKRVSLVGDLIAGITRPAEAQEQLRPEEQASLLAAVFDSLTEADLAVPVCQSHLIAAIGGVIAGVSPVLEDSNSRDSDWNAMFQVHTQMSTLRIKISMNLTNATDSPACAWGWLESVEGLYGAAAPTSPEDAVKFRKKALNDAVALGTAIRNSPALQEDEELTDAYWAAVASIASKEWALTGGDFLSAVRQGIDASPA
jgi:hypothetical protein